MSAYHLRKGKRRPLSWRKLLLGTSVLLIGAALIAVGIIWHGYQQNLKPLDRDQTAYPVIIPSGYTPRQTADKLKTGGLIRSATAFQWYIRLRHLGSKLQAGTYSIKSSESVPTIASMMAEGKIERNYVIILPAQRLDQIEDEFKNDKFDPTAVTRAFDPSQYSNIPVLADKPAGASLEGYLYPDTFFRESDTDPAAIVRQSLEEMNQHVTADMKAGFATNGLSVYQGISLASVVEQEVSKPTDRAQVAQVFLTRLKRNMPLGSDVTYFYSQHVGNPAYDKTTNTGLPPGPISNVSDSSLQAVAHPASTNWLYFVTGDNGITYFSTTYQQHQAYVQQYCHKLCGR